MKLLTHTLTIIVVLLFVQGLSGAQTQSPNAPPSVTASANSHRVRFVSMGEVQQTRLQIFAADGTQLFDSQFKAGNLIDWMLENQQGTRVPDGRYLFLVTVKDFTGKLSQKYGTTQLDQDQIYVEQTEASDLFQSEVSALEASRQGDSLAVVDRIGAGVATGTNAVTNLDSKTSSKSANSAGSNITPPVGTGATGKLTKWMDGISGTLGDSIITESENNIGIGTSSPSQKLEVTGFGKFTNPGNDSGIQFESGSIYRSAATGNINIAPQAQANTAFVSGNVGIGTTTPGQKLEVVGFGKFSNPGNDSGIQFEMGSIYRSATTGNINIAPQANTAFVSGNVGIGTATPGQKLEVAGFGKFSNPGNDSGIQFESGSIYRSAATGNINIAPQAQSNTAFVSGNVGIGTTTPGQKLEVAGFGKFSNPGNDSGIQFESGTIYRSAANGNINIAPQAQANTAFVSGNVGIGVLSPAAKLDVAGDVSVTGNGTFAGSIAAKSQGTFNTVTVGAGGPTLSKDGDGALFLTKEIRSRTDGSSGAGVGFGCNNLDPALLCFGADVPGDTELRWRVDTNGREVWSDGVGGSYADLYLDGGSGLATHYNFSIGGVLRMPHYGAGTATFDARGNVTSSSDERLKRDIRPFTRGRAALLGLRPILHGYTKESGLDQTKDDYAGFSAQNVQRFIPEAVSRNSDGTLSLNDRGILATLVNTVQEQERQIEKQRREITTLRHALKRRKR